MTSESILLENVGYYFDKNAFLSVICPKYCISDEIYLHSSGDKT